MYDVSSMNNIFILMLVLNRYIGDMELIIFNDEECRKTLGGLIYCERKK